MDRGHAITQAVSSWLLIAELLAQCHYYRHNTTQSHIYILFFLSQHVSASVGHLEVLALTPKLLYSIEGRLRPKHVKKKEKKYIFEIELYCDGNIDIVREIVQQMLKYKQNFFILG
jgi:hypothetical protein